MMIASSRLLIASVLVLGGLNSPVHGHQRYNRQQRCYQNIYSETYHPGTRKNPGYVTSSEKMIAKKCPKNYHSHGKFSHKHIRGRLAHDHHSHAISKIGASPLYAPELDIKDTNSCIEGTLAGGVLGGALGGVLAKKENWIWSIPVGAVGGAIVGCQADGG